MRHDRFGAANRDYWDERAAFNAQSWDVEGFLADAGRLTAMVEADRHEVGEVQGKSLIHLQCHFGLDTLAWARLGARVTGVDFARRAIVLARGLAARAGLAARFVEAELYQAPAAVRETFDALLAPGGLLYLHEAHPVLWALEDERPDRELVIGLPYFEPDQPKRWDDLPAWDPERPRLSHRTQYVWAHGLGEILSALLEAGLVIRSFKEHRRCLWQALHFMVQDRDGWWVLPEHQERLPLMYSLRALKPPS
jgi:SAM-dependent methyltransferase